MPQLSYGRTMDPGFPGMKADATDDTINTGVSEETTAEIPFGVAVALGTAQDGVKLPAGGTDLIVGVNVHDNACFLGALGGIPPKSPVNVGRKVRVWVRPEDAVTPASKVFVRHAVNGGFTQVGTFRGTTATGATQELYGCSWKSSASAGGLAILEVDFQTVKAFVDKG